jgi:O-antigen/teichoic acid export membrane protein
MKPLSFYKGLSWLVVLNLLVKPVWIFCIDRQVQNTVGHETYGKYFAMLNLSYVLIFLADAGLSNMINQRLANTLLLNVKQVLRIKFILLLLYMFACCFVGWLSRISEWEILWYVMIIQVFTSLFIFLRGLITAHQYFTADAWFSVIDKLLMVLLCGSLIYTSWFGKIDMLIFLRLQMICTAIAVACALVFILRKGWIYSGEKQSVDRLTKMVTPFALIILLMSAHYRLDGFLLERIHAQGAEQAGIYATAYRLLDAGNMLGYLAASFLVPFIARRQNEKKLVGEVVLNMRHALLFFSAGLVMFTIMFAAWIQRLLYHSDDPYISSVIALSASALPAYYLVHIYGSVLTATSQFNSFIKILLVSVILNLTLNLILIPGYGAYGCCIAAVVSQYFCGITCAIVASRRSGIAPGQRSLIAYAFLTALLGGVFYGGKAVISNVWIILAAGVCLTLLLLFIQLGLFKKLFISFR